MQFTLGEYKVPITQLGANVYIISQYIPPAFTASRKLLVADFSIFYSLAFLPSLCFIYSLSGTSYIATGECFNLDSIS